jgi:cation transport ATPase
MFLQAFKHWPDLIAGGRILHFQSLACWGQKSFIISLRGDPSASILSMHSVPLDVLATIGFWPALPMLSFLAIAFYAFIRFSFIWFHPFRENIHLLSQAGAHILVFWSVLAAIIPQWLFQPLIYGDALLYYLSYAMIGFLIVIGKPVKELRCA